jgi:MAP kinase interacting serine/threonine kinase
VKIIEKTPGLFSRSKVLKEVEIYHLCRGQQNIIQLIEYFEEPDGFYLVFEKINGGPLLKHIQKRVCFTEREASRIIRDLAEAIQHLHTRGIAHRDIKPDNVLCVNSSDPCPVKLCDFDLCSQPVSIDDCRTPALLTPVGSLEYMAPEVVDTFICDDFGDDDDDKTLTYNKKCDLWSLGIIMYILLCGYAPFSGYCGSDCGWDRGESCPDCQEKLFSSIKEEEVVFPEQHWSSISKEAKDLIQHLLVKDSSRRLDASQILNHTWIVRGGSSNSLETPNNLRRQTSLKELEDFASRAMAVNRKIEDMLPSTNTTAPIPIPLKRSAFSFDLTPPSLSKCSLLQRRRRSKEKIGRFSSIEEMDTDMFMRAIC